MEHTKFLLLLLLDIYYNAAWNRHADSEECKVHGMCGLMTFPHKNCYCDNLCHVMNDCCENAASVNISMKQSQFTCEHIHLHFEPGMQLFDSTIYGVLMVTRCSEEWTDDYSRTLCENTYGDPDGDLILQTPVSDNTQSNFVYKNMYCAFCNNINEFRFWNPQYECENKRIIAPGTPTHDLFLDIPDDPDCWLQFESQAMVRMCELRPTISICPSTTDGNLVLKCKTSLTIWFVTVLVKPIETRIVRNATEWQKKTYTVRYFPQSLVSQVSRVSGFL